MDDFEKEYPEFDWKNTPAYKHPGGKDCPCPKHEYIREQINVAKTVSETSKESSSITLKFCPDHYRVYLKEVIPAMPLKYRILTKIALKIGAIKVEQLKVHAIRPMFLLQVWIWRSRQEKRIATYYLDWTYQNFWFVWSVVMTFLSTKWTCYPVQKDALTNMRLHVTVCSSAIFPSSVAKRTLSI